MKKKISISQNHYFLEVLSTGCWTQAYRKKQNPLKRLFKRYQKGLDTALASLAIGLMRLTGIWIFLIQLAEFGFSS